MLLQRHRRVSPREQNDRVMRLETFPTGPISGDKPLIHQHFSTIAELSSEVNRAFPPGAYRSARAVNFVRRNPASDTSLRRTRGTRQSWPSRWTNVRRTWKAWGSNVIRRSPGRPRHLHFVPASRIWFRNRHRYIRRWAFGRLPQARFYHSSAGGGGGGRGVS